MFSKKNIKIQWITRPFKMIAKKKRIEVKEVLNGNMRSTELFKAFTVYEYISSDTGETISVVETGAGNGGDNIVLATATIKGKISGEDAKMCVLAIEKDYLKLDEQSRKRFENIM